ncbi:MAG: hypothetical protein Kow0088_24640 [Anaerolineales bacterium]
MKRGFSSLVGYLLIFSAGLGFLLSLFGLVITLRYAGHLTVTLQEQILLAESVMDTTAQGLDVASQTLETTRMTVRTLDETVQTFSQSITDTLPLLDTIGGMIGEDLPDTIHSTQVSLSAAQQSARVIESVLGTLTAIPFFPGDPYEPEVPLYVALGDVSSSLNDLPQAFRVMQENLLKSGANLATAQADIQKVRGEVAQVESNLQQAQAILKQYRQTALHLRDQFESLRLKTPQLVRWGTIFFSLFLVWLATAQVGLLSQGLDLIHRPAVRGDE